MINKTPQNKNKGFTLIEVLVAIFILITAVVVPLTIGSKAFAYSNFVRDQSTASYLAQEAVEYIRLQRDNASLQYDGFTDPWESFSVRVKKCDGSGVGCTVDVESGNIEECSVIGCPALYLNPNTGRYEYTSDKSAVKGFTRTVKVTFEGSGVLRRVKISVDVSWNTNGIDKRNFEVIDYLTPWQI